MKLKKGIALMTVLALGSANLTVYASEKVGDSEAEIVDQNAEELQIKVSVEQITGSVGENKYFYVDTAESSTDQSELQILAENDEIIEVQSCLIEEIADEKIKENTPQDVWWYKVTGKSAGETTLSVEKGDAKQVITVVISETVVPNEPEAEQPEDGGNESEEKSTENNDLQESTTLSLANELKASQTGWIEEGGEKYYLGNDGKKSTGIIEIEGILYYFDDTTGALCKSAKWIEKSEKRYYCSNEGVVYRNQFISFGTIYYYMGTDGSVTKGTFSVGDKKYHSNSGTGEIKLESGWIEDDGKRYYANAEGVIFSNQFISFGTISYYMGTDGSVTKGTFSAGGKKYHANSSTGEMKLMAGWIEDDGKRYYANAEGAIYCTQLISFGSTQYYMGTDGSVQTGVVMANGVVYYADENTGVIQKKAGWIEYKGKKYYSKADGVLYSNQFVSFGKTQYYMGTDGSVQTGVIKADEKVYYADENTGVIQKKAGWIEYKGRKYYSKADGVLYSNQFVSFGITQYYMGSDGSVQTGVIKVSGKVYYADKNTGVIQKKAGWIEYKGRKYYSKADGVLYSNQFVSFGTTQYYMGSDGSVQKGVLRVNGKVYYSDLSTGIIQKKAGWIEYNGKKYYSAADGVLYSNQFVSFGKTQYYMGTDGSVQTGVIKVDGKVYYASLGTGIIQKKAGWIEYKGRSYYSAADGVLYSNQFLSFGKTQYYMGSDGSVQKGVLRVNGKVYYSDLSTGIIQKKAGWIEYNGKKYYSAADGVLYSNQFVSFGTTQYYMGADGSVQKGSQYINGKWYYFDEKTGVLQRSDGWFSIGSNKYYQKSNGTLAKGYTDINGIRHYFNQSGVLSSKVGIDVSEFQGNINWNSVKKAGVEFAFIRVGYRGYGTGKLVVDSKFKENISGALMAGVKVGVYFWSQAITVAEAREEAMFVYNQIKNYNIQYPVVFDSEFINSSRVGRADKLSVSARTLMISTFCAEIRKRNYAPMVYSSTSFLNTYIDMSLLTNYQTWVAQYNSTLTYRRSYRCWQYTSAGRVNGINGNVDMNVWIN